MYIWPCREVEGGYLQRQLQQQLIRPPFSAAGLALPVPSSTHPRWNFWLPLSLLTVVSLAQSHGWNGVDFSGSHGCNATLPLCCVSMWIQQLSGGICSWPLGLSPGWQPYEASMVGPCCIVHHKTLQDAPCQLCYDSWLTIHPCRLCCRHSTARHAAVFALPATQQLCKRMGPAAVFYKASMRT